MIRIVKIQLYAVKQRPPDYSWSPVMPEVLNTDTIVRVTDETGAQGIGSVCSFTEFDVDKSVLESLRPLAMALCKTPVCCVQTHWHKMKLRRPGVSNTAMAAIDFALWDLEAKRARQPLHKFLGSRKQTVPAYASIPILDSPADYIRLITSLREDGFRCFKFHYKSKAEPDCALIEQVSQAFDDTYQFMFDAENLYTDEEALRVATVMAERGFIWLEAPFDDHNWPAYHRLRQKALLPIIPAGNSVVDSAHIQQAIKADCWDALRLDAATAGGITPCLDIFSTAEDNGLMVELQSWGSSLSTAANLHLALARQNSTYFEIPVPRGDFTISGAADFQLNEDGEINAPTGDGIGLEIDWSQIERTASACVTYEL